MRRNTDFNSLARKEQDRNQSRLVKQKHTTEKDMSEFYKESIFKSIGLLLLDNLFYVIFFAVFFGFLAYMALF